MPGDLQPFFKCLVAIAVGIEFSNRVSWNLVAALSREAFAIILMGESLCAAVFAGGTGAESLFVGEKVVDRSDAVWKKWNKRGTPRQVLIIIGVFMNLEFITTFTWQPGERLGFGRVCVVVFG